MILRKKNYLFKNVFNFKYIKNIIIHSKMIYIYIYIYIYNESNISSNI